MPTSTGRRKKMKKNILTDYASRMGDGIPYIKDPKQRALACPRKAPWWRLGWVAPSVARDLEVRRIVVQRRIWRRLISVDGVETTFDFQRENPLDYVVSAMDKKSVGQLVILKASDGTPLSEWTNAFVKAVLAREDLFKFDLLNPATARVNLSSQEKKLYLYLGRILGLMLARGVQVDSISFEETLCRYLLFRSPAMSELADLKEDYPREYNLLRAPATFGWNQPPHAGEKTGLLKLIPDAEREYVSNFSDFKFSAYVWSEKLIKYYALDRGRNQHVIIADGFREVAGDSLEVSKSVLRQLLTKRATDVDLNELEKGISYSVIDRLGKEMVWFWTIAAEPGFPRTQLLARLINSETIPAPGQYGNLGIVFARNTSWTQFRIKRSERTLFIPKCASMDDMREGLNRLLGVQ